jgi:hypothetical protein
MILYYFKSKYSKLKIMSNAHTSDKIFKMQVIYFFDFNNFS